MFDVWKRLGNEDRNIFPLLESLAAVASRAGMAFARYAQPVYEQCLKMIEGCLLRDARQVRYLVLSTIQTLRFTCDCAHVIRRWQ